MTSSALPVLSVGDWVQTRQRNGGLSPDAFEAVAVSPRRAKLRIGGAETWRSQDKLERVRDLSPFRARVVLGEMCDLVGWAFSDGTTDLKWADLTSDSQLIVTDALGRHWQITATPLEQQP